VRHEAFNGLAEVGTKDAVETLSKVAAGGSEEDRRAAIGALGNLDGEAGHDALARVLTTERDPTLVLAAIREARSGGAILNDALQTVLRDPGAAREVQTAAAERLDAVGALADTDRHYLESDDVLE
jgi:HEAT repeat protein